MAGTDTQLEALWEEFHRVVNMNSRELSTWLRTSSAGEETEALPEDMAQEKGQGVLAILQKRRTDLTDDDIQLMSDVVEEIRTELAAGPGELEPESEWRHRLMSLGHDPLHGG